MRTSIAFTEDITDTMAKMSEGNPGALTVLINAAKTLEPVKNVAFLMHLDDMNIRGAQIWVGYKDHCGQYLDKFVEKVESRDSDMVKVINDELTRYDPNAEIAVTQGASLER